MLSSWHPAPRCLMTISSCWASLTVSVFSCDSTAFRSTCLLCSVGALVGVSPCVCCRRCSEFPAYRTSGYLVARALLLLFSINFLDVIMLRFVFHIRLCWSFLFRCHPRGPLSRLPLTQQGRRRDKLHLVN